MEHNFGMNKKGQSSIEFILLISIAMIYISTIILPSVEVSKRATDDVMQLSQARFATEKFANTIDGVYASSGAAKTTITVLVPARAKVSCLNCDFTTDPPSCNQTAPFNAVGFDFWLTADDQTPLLENPACPKETSAPEKSICTKLFKTITEFNCQTSVIGEPSMDPSANNTLAEIGIEKDADGVINVTTREI